MEYQGEYDAYHRRDHAHAHEDRAPMIDVRGIIGEPNHHKTHQECEHDPAEKIIPEKSRYRSTGAYDLDDPVEEGAARAEPAADEPPLEESPYDPYQHDDWHGEAENRIF